MYLTFLLLLLLLFQSLGSTITITHCILVACYDHIFNLSWNLLLKPTSLRVFNKNSVFPQRFVNFFQHSDVISMNTKYSNQFPEDLNKILLGTFNLN